jgi:hypothetical protein
VARLLLEIGDSQALDEDRYPDDVQHRGLPADAAAACRGGAEGVRSSSSVRAGSAGATAACRSSRSSAPPGPPRHAADGRHAPHRRLGRVSACGRLRRQLSPSGRQRCRTRRPGHAGQGTPVGARRPGHAGQGTPVTTPDARAAATVPPRRPSGTARQGRVPARRHRTPAGARRSTHTRRPRSGNCPASPTTRHRPPAPARQHRGRPKDAGHHTRRPRSGNCPRLTDHPARCAVLLPARPSNYAGLARRSLTHQGLGPCHGASLEEERLP